MSLFDEVFAAFVRTDDLADARARRLDPAADATEVAALAKARAISERAHFLLLFAAVEQEINKRILALLDPARMGAQAAKIGRSGPSWDELLNRTVRSIRLLDRVALLLAANSAELGDFRDLQRLRNDLAHAGTSIKPVDFALVAAQLEAIAKAL